MVPLPRVTDGWDVSNTTLWSPTLLYVESLQQTHIVQKSVVQQLVQCKDVSLVHQQPSDTHHYVVQQQLWSHLIAGIRKIYRSQDRLNSCSAGASYAAKWRVIDFRLQVQNLNAPSEPCLYRGSLDAFEELDIIHSYRQISYKPAESFLLECLLLFSLLRLWRAALQMGLIESRAAFKALLIKRQSLPAMMAVPSLQWRSFASVQIISRWIIKLFHELEYWVLFLNIITGGSKTSIDVYEVFCCGEMILIKFVSRPPARL